MKPGPSGPLRTGWLDQPDPSRLAPDHPRRAEILARHERAVASGLSAYLDPGTGYSVLTARQRIKGVEFEVQGRVTPAWSITAQASFLDPQVLADTTAGANVGNRVALATRRTASLWTQYRLPQVPGMWVGGGLVSQGNKYTANDNRWLLPGYTVAELAAGYQFANGVRLQANLKNAANRRYYVDAATTTAGFAAVTPGEPRSLYVALDYAF